MKKVIPAILSTLLIQASCIEQAKHSNVADGQVQTEIRNAFFSEAPSVAESTVHQVIILEILQASNYSYLFVSEDEREYWLATLKDEFAIGEEYYYTKALHKTNFKSKEHNRVFNELYLVSKLMPASHAQNTAVHQHGENCNHGAEGQDLNEIPFNAEAAPVSVRISDLVANPQSYMNSYVIVSGQCSKVNNAIMDRNWVHIKDGSLDSYDLIVTTQESIIKGQELRLKARIALNKDFGAGYSYSLILEEGELLP